MEKVKLGDLITYAKGKPPVDDASSIEEVILLTPEYLRGTSQPVKVAKTPNLVMVDEGEVLLLWDGSNAGEFFLSKKGALASTMVRIDINDQRFIKDYIYYSLKAFEPTLKGKTSGSGIPHVDKEILNAYELIKFDKKEQQLIADILSSVNHNIGLTISLIKKHTRIKIGMMADLLTNGIDENGQIRTEKINEYKNSPLGKVPVEWNVDKLEAYLENIEQGWSPQCDFESASTGEWGVLKTSSVTWDGYNQNENKRLPSHLTPRVQYEVKENDVLMTRGGPNSRVGVVCFVERTREKLILSDKLYRLVPNEHIRPRYLALVLSSVATQRHLSTMKTGMAESQTNISQEIVKNLYIKVMSTDEQDRIIDLISLIDKKINKLNDKLTKLQKMKEGLRKDLLIGKVRVTRLMVEDVAMF